MSDFDKGGAAFGMVSGASTLAQRLEITKNRPSGFDYLRTGLACSVICWHSIQISHGWTTETGGLGWRFVEVLSFLIVPMFFAVSGFLVAGSLERSSSLIVFLGHRVLRIVPALAVEVLLSALVLGPIFTTESLSKYFLAPSFLSYFMNILGDIHYNLPGLFEYNPTSMVNAQLWTVPWEEICYVLLAILAVAGIFRRRQFLIIFLILFHFMQIINFFVREQNHFQGAAGSSVVMAFMTGVVFYRYRDRIVWSRWLCLAMFIVSIALPVLIPKGIRFAQVPIAYVTVYLGLTNPRRDRFILSGDYSYGLYLYGFPVQQAVYTVFPGFHSWYASVLLTVPIVIVIAVASWWLVERPVLSKRELLKILESWYINHFRGQFFNRAGGT